MRELARETGFHRNHTRYPGKDAAPVYGCFKHRQTGIGKRDTPNVSKSWSAKGPTALKSTATPRTIWWRAHCLPFVSYIRIVYFRCAHGVFLTIGSVLAGFRSLLSFFNLRACSMPHAHRPCDHHSVHDLVLAGVSKTPFSAHDPDRAGKLDRSS